MESILVSEYSIISNLRRTSSKGLFSCLSQHQLNDLALKYFGIYDNNKLVGYECPYSGKKITSTEDIVLEHIIPVSSGGGTALFNCIPTSVEVNKISEKGDKHLISWWLNSKYWNSTAPVRLEKIIEYLLEAYDITFINGDQVSDYDDFDYDEDENNNDLENQEGDLSTTQEEQNVESASLITYYNFINELIDELREYKDVTIYQNRLQNLINQNIFGNIERQTLIQNSLKDIIKNRLELEDRSELTLLQKIDIYIMTKSLENILDDNIYSELEQRMDNLDIILQNNNLSLNSLFMDRNSLNYLYKSTSDLTEEDIKELVENINMCVADKFNAMIQFIKDNKGDLPKQGSNNKQEQQLAILLYSIKTISKKTGKFSTQLTHEQLRYLHDSEYESLRDVYKEILYRAIENDILIEYVDEEMESKIRKYNELLKNSNSIEEQIRLEQEYADYIIIKSQFNQFIDFVLNKELKGTLPSQLKDADKNEQQLAQFLHSIKTISKKTGKFSTQLTQEQLRYLHDSEYESLKDVYKEILHKAIENNILIEYVDEEMKSKIIEYIIARNKLIKDNNYTIENQIELERKYNDVIIIKSQFNQFIDFVLNTEPKGTLPSKSKDADKNEQQLAQFLQSIKTIKKKTGKFSTQLTQEQLRYLHDSEYKSLRDVYKEILLNAIENEFLIEYVDEEMASKIREYNELLKNSNSIEEQIRLEREYANYIIIESQFNQFIDFVLNTEPKGILPSQLKDADKNEQQLARFLHSIKSINKNAGKFYSQLTQEQLRYLHDSEYESLRDVYKEILYKAIENDILIEYVDEEMVSKIREYNELLKNSNSIEEQIRLEQEYANYIIIESQFNQFIDFVLNTEPKGTLPSKSKDADENEQQLAQFLQSIKTIKKKTGKFRSQLTQEQLKYLHDSEYESLRDVYKEILYKAIENDILIEYVDEEMASKIREYNELLKNSNSIEEQIRLEQEYANYIIIESQFNQFIDFVLNTEPKGTLPSQLKDADKNERQLARFLNSIKSINKKAGKFNSQLTQEQLRYLHDSEYESLRKIYYEIIEKAIAIHYQPYIEVDNEFKNSKKGKVA